MNDYFYNCINAYNAGFKPSTVHTINNSTYQYFFKYLFQKAVSVFKWDIPKNWNRDYFLYTLYGTGFVCVFDSVKYGVIPQECSLSGIDIFRSPAYAIITNYKLPKTEYKLRIGTDCVLFKLQPDYQGIIDIVNYYAEMLALATQAVDMNLINSKLSYVFACKDKNTAESFKKIYDKIATGEPAVFSSNKLFDEQGKANWHMFNQDLKSNYIVNNLLNDMDMLENQFCTDIGIPNVNIMKKERVNTEEVNANNIETYTKCDMWLDSLKNACNYAHDMFGVSIGVDWRFSPDG